MLEARWHLTGYPRLTAPDVHYAKAAFHPDHESDASLPELAQTDLLVVVLVQDLGSRQVKVFLRNVHASLSQRVHTGFRADTLQFGAGAAVHFLGDLGQIDSAGEVHGAGMDAKNIGSGFNTACC